MNNEISTFKNKKKKSIENHYSEVVVHVCACFSYELVVCDNPNGN